MAPINKLKTYGRSNRSLVSNPAEAVNLFFQKAKAKGRKKRKFFIKELPARSQAETLLGDDSLHVSTEDTFDKLFRGGIYNHVNLKSHMSIVNNSSTDASSSIKTMNSFYSPIMTRRKKKNASIQELSNGSTNRTGDKVNSKDKSSSIPRFKEPTVDRIDFSLEIEKESKPIAASLSYIVIPKLKENDVSVDAPQDSNSKTDVPSFDPVFTKTFREKQLIHSSTPLAPSKVKKIVNYTISPIGNASSEQVLNSVSVACQSGRDWKLMSEPSVADPVPSFSGYGNLERNQSELALQHFYEVARDVKSYDSSQSPGNRMPRQSFITLRRRKVLKSSRASKSRRGSKSVDTNKNAGSMSVSLVDFNAFVERINDTSAPEIRSSCYDLKDFQTFERQSKELLISGVDVENSLLGCVSDLSGKFITERRKRLTDSDVLVVCKKQRTGEGNRRFSSQEASDFRQQDLVVLLPKIVMSQESDGSSTCFSRCEDNKDSIAAKDFAVNLTRMEVQCITPSVCGTDNSLLEASQSLFEESCGQCNVSKACQTLQDNSGLHEKSESVVASKQTPRSKNSSYMLEQDFEEMFANITKHLTQELIQDTYLTQDKELIVKLVKSAWRKDQDAKSENSTNRSVVIDLTDSVEEISNKQSGGSNNSVFNQEEFRRHSISDIIESSVLESSDGFKIPRVNNRKRQSKTLVLKAGKLWRRSLSVYKRSSMMVTALNEDACRLANGGYCACPRCTLARQCSRVSNKRLSIRIVPTRPLGEAQREVSILENYAYNASYVSERILEDNLESDLRSLSLSKRKTSVVQDPAPVTARELVLKRCGQTEPLPFEQCYPKSVLKNCQKIGEGVYGEVFLFRNPNGGTSVMKVIPIEGDLLVNGERQKKFEEILTEITIALELSNLRNKKRNKTGGFSEVQKVCCVQGRYPDQLVYLWDLYDETRGSENDSPDIFGEDQLYIVLQLADGGKDMEAFVFNNSLQAYTMFQQVACALAVAEEELRFEHRDLHWGNILVSTVDKNEKITFRLEDKSYEIMTKGVAVAIIDFTLSRIECEGVVIFNDLGLDPELFTAEGDYQFEVYKLMQKKNGNNWQRFEPYTNVLWLHYVLDKAVAALRYKNAQSKVHKEYLAKLRQLKAAILDYNSAKEFVSENF